MQNRNLDEINDEIFRIKSIINPMEDYLSNHPDDLSVQANVDNLNDRLNQLYFKLNNLKNEYGLSIFDLYLSNVGGGKIKLSNLIKTTCQFQKTLISCSMYDGIHPVDNKAMPSQDIIDYSDFDVEIVETNSLKIILSVGENREKITYDSPIYFGLKNLMDIISCGEDKEKINELMKSIGVPPFLMYKKLLKILKDNDLNLDIFHSIIPKGFKTQNLSNDFANKVYPIIEDITMDVI